jgi:hypothetical protein
MREVEAFTFRSDTYYFLQRSKEYFTPYSSLEICKPERGGFSQRAKHRPSRKQTNEVTKLCPEFWQRLP